MYANIAIVTGTRKTGKSALTRYTEMSPPSRRQFHDEMTVGEDGSNKRTETKVTGLEKSGL
jgi:hypothetical protein